AVPLAEDARAVTRARTLPHHHEVARPVGSHGRMRLIGGRGGIHPEFTRVTTASGRPRAVVALPEDAVAAAVLSGSVPHHQEVSAGAPRHARVVLIARLVRVHRELGTLPRPGAVVALAEDTGARVPVAIA